jgi:hypothetical protein
MSNNQEHVERMVPLWSLLLAFVCALAVIFAVHRLDFPGSVPDFKQHSHGGQLLDTRPTFDAGAVQERMAGYGGAGRASYRFRLWTVDLLLPLAVTPFLVLWMRRALQAVRPGRRLGRALLAVAFVYLAFDLAENAWLFTLLSIHPDRNLVLEAVLPYLTALKRTGLFGALTLPLMLLAFTRVRQWRRKEEEASSSFRRRRLLR